MNMGEGPWHGHDPIMDTPDATEAIPVISVIMPCFNGAETIGGAIASVQAQTFTNWELVVVDDGSSDDSAKVVSDIGDLRVRLIKQPNKGAAAARNRGLREARGFYIAFLDADDSWDLTFLEKMLAALDPQIDAGLAYCGWQNVGIEGGRGKPFVPPDYDPLDRAEVLLGGCRWPIHGVLLPREVIEAAGGFDETLGASEDYDLWLRLSPRGRLVRVPEVLAFYHHHEGTQITKNRLRVALSHWTAQHNFLRRNPREASRLGRKRLRDLMVGELLRQGYLAYWKRDLYTARALFRKVMRHGYGRPKDWLYMLPSLLPLSLHQRLVVWRDADLQKSKEYL